MKVAIILNQHAGLKELTGEKLESVFKEKGVEPKIFKINGEEITDTVKSILDSEFDIIAVAGGDGTISTVAGVLAGTKMPLAVIPGGTFNHFAKDLNIPLDLEDAVQVVADAHQSPVDVAEVNGKVFINNSSVGLYPKAVKKRKEYFHQLGGNKILAMIIASFSIFTRFPLFTVFLKAEEEKLSRTTPFVFIGNNEYKMDLFNLGARQVLTEGRLSLYTANCRKRLSIVRFVFMALMNRIKQDKDFDLRFVREVRLETGKHPVRVALDGEIIRMQPPMHYKIRPKDLQVILPKQAQKEASNQ